MPQGDKPPKVLIGDDSEILNNSMRDAFEFSVFEVVQAFDGYQCKAVYLQERPDVTFLDIRMPEKDGIDVLRFIKEKNPDAIVVMMTGAVASDEVAVRAMKAGADDYLRKPFKLLEVVELARRLLEARKAEKESVRLKREIRRVERDLAHLTKIINEALITTDLKGAIEFTNRAASDMWGYSPEEMKGKDIHFLVRGEARTLLFRDLVKDTLRQGRLEGEFNFRNKRGGAFPGYLSSSVITENERARGIVIVVADLTKLYDIESRLKQTEKLASLGKVVEGVAHEVRNCLTSLGGFALRLRKVTVDNADAQQFVGIILDDVARLEQMVRQIEDYVRFSKFYTFKFVKVDVTEIIGKAHDRVLREISPPPAATIAFTLRADKNLSQITADPSALEEILFNVLLNAYEAMPSGGRLTVRAKNLPSAVSVAITDTGVGISEEDLPEVFTPFFTSKMSGAGMGLSKVSLLVEEHRGSVNVTSQLGKGTTFEIFLPVERLMTGLYAGESASRSGPFR